MTNTDRSATRRAVIGALAPALALGGLAVRDAAAQPPMAKRAGGPDTKGRTSLHQEVTIAASPRRVYAALLSSKAFAAFTGLPATIDPHAGGAVSMFGGLILGRNIELIPGERIVQAWRSVQDWPPGVYSLVRFELAAQGAGTLVKLDQTGFPPGDFDHLDAGWGPRYFEPLRKYLGRRGGGR